MRPRDAAPLILALALLHPILVSCEPEGNLTREIGEGKVAVMFWSRLCSTCEEIMPHWIELERNPPEGVKVIDVELVPGRTDELFLRLGIRETPTFILFVNGEEVKRFSGHPGGEPAEFLRRWMTEDERPLFGELVSFSALGGMIALSPCSLPLMMSLSSLARLRTRRSYATCFLATTAGILTLGLLVLVASSLAIWLARWVTRFLAVAAVSLGIYSLILPERSCKLPGRGPVGRLRGGPLACFGAGLAMVQCNFPLLTGSLILLGSLRDISRGIMGLASLSLSLGLGLVILAATSRRLAAGFSGGMRRVHLTRLGGALLAAMGIYILLSY